MNNFKILPEADCDTCVMPGGEHMAACPRRPVEVTVEAVNHPKHYNAHPSGIECIQVIEHMGFNLGNVIKYLWRAEEKGAPLEDLKKARWYLDREIAKRSSTKGK